MGTLPWLLATQDDLLIGHSREVYPFYPSFDASCEVSTKLMVSVPSTAVFLTCCWPQTCPWVSHWCQESYGQVTVVVGNSGWLIKCIRSGDTQDIIHINILNLGTPQSAGGIPEGLTLLGRLLSLVCVHTRTLGWGKSHNTASSFDTEW